ncbi:hypothetical protein [Ignatzschineria indica]|nr:hypothetical protein [Ignatzschineria indica]
MKTKKERITMITLSLKTDLTVTLPMPSDIFRYLPILLNIY